MPEVTRESLRRSWAPDVTTFPVDQEELVDALLVFAGEEGCYFQHGEACAEAAPSVREWCPPCLAERAAALIHLGPKPPTFDLGQRVRVHCPQYSGPGVVGIVKADGSGVFQEADLVHWQNGRWVVDVTPWIGGWETGHLHTNTWRYPAADVAIVEDLEAPE